MGMTSKAYVLAAIVATVLMSASAATASASTIVSSTVSSRVDLQAALKMAQCRSHCLDQYEGEAEEVWDEACHHNTHCSGCWETCELLATNFPIWSLTCGQRDICSSGCDEACEFFSSHPQSAIPLSQHNSRLTLVFSGTSAHWTLAWGRAAPREHVVYAVFRRGSNQAWQSLLQTAAPAASLAALSPGDDMKLVAVAESGVLSVIITPYAPPPHNKAGLMVPPPQTAHDRPQANDIDAGGEDGWALRHEAEVEESGLVAARVWWPPVSPRGADYLVTWEVEGGGLKGHLYTDLSEVDLTLWPETVYQVQVEAVAGPISRPLRSAHLTLDTHNISLIAHAATRSNRITPTLPLVHKAIPPVSLEVVAGAAAGVVVALLLAAGLVYRHAKSTATSIECPVTSVKADPWTRTLPEKTLDDTLVKVTSPTFHPSHPFAYSNLLPPTLSPHSHAHANLYSIVPESRPHVTNI